MVGDIKEKVTALTLPQGIFASDNTPISTQSTFSLQHPEKIKEMKS